MAKIMRAASARLSVAAGLVLTAWSPAVLAQSDYHDKDFSVRLASAFIKFTEVSAMGGQTVANRFSSAANPASAGWFALPEKLGLVVSPYYSPISFQNGTCLHIIGESLTWDTRTWGAFQPTLSQIRTNEVEDRQGMSFDYSVDTAQMQWGKRFGDWALGAAFNFAGAHIEREGTVRQTVPGVPMPVPVSVDSHASAESYRWRFGGLYQPVEKWLLGLIFEYGFQPYRSKTQTTIPLPGPMGPITSTLHDEGTQQQFIFRPGVSYEYAKLSTVYLDYQYGQFFNPRDRLTSHRFSTGVEHRLLDWLFLRVGPSIDVRGNVGLSTGASVFLSQWCSLDLGYQYNMLSELRPELGRSNAFQATLALRF